MQMYHVECGVVRGCVLGSLETTSLDGFLFKSLWIISVGLDSLKVFKVSFDKSLPLLLMTLFQRSILTSSLTVFLDCLSVRQTPLERQLMLIV